MIDKIMNHFTSQISEILRDTNLLRIIDEESSNERRKRFNDIMNSQYSFSIIYHPQQKDRLGTVDSFGIEGGDMTQRILDLKIQYNVGISQIRISKNGKRIKTINLNGNQINSLPFKRIKLFNNI